MSTIVSPFQVQSLQAVLYSKFNDLKSLIIFRLQFLFVLHLITISIT